MSASQLETINKLYLELSHVATAQTERELELIRTIDELKDVLRSAHCIARRQGENTDWLRFANRISGLGIGSVTAKVFKLSHSDEIEET